MLEGTKIGSYEITARIGAGGMGEVYRARDTRLGRDVALKILPDAFASDPDRLARFQREAQVLASLNHPHIASIYGLEEGATVASGQAAVKALVLELVEGPTLADRISQGPIPLDEALAIAKQIAEALDAAHEAGIVHRDLKPANVKVKADGTVKVLDFGLAKAVEAGGAGGPGGAGASGGDNLSQSPTITTPAMTEMGMILGTAAYMAPEQAKGRRVDKRVDVWALGALLYEMLTGSRTFGRNGDDVADTLAAVLRADPDWTKLPATTPPSIRRLLRRSLEKDVRLRLSDMAMVQVELRDASNPEVGAGPAVSAAKPSFIRRVMPYAAVVVTAAATAAIVWRVRAPAEEVRPIVRYSIDLPDKMQLSSPNRDAVAISPDGTRIAYAANNRIYLRNLDQTEARPIEGTEGGGPAGYARLPFFSPDGQWIGFWQQNALKKVPLSGGGPTTVCEVTGIPLNVSWEADGEILLSGPPGIARVSASGGTLEVVIKTNNELISSVQALSEGQWILFVTHRSTTLVDQGEVVVQNRSTGERRVLVKDARDARYVPTGHIVFGRGNTLFAQAFDTGRLAVSGSPVPVLEGVAGAATNTNPILHFALSSNGTIVYVPGNTAGAPAKTNLVQVMRSGSRLPLQELSGTAWFPRVSPDGTRVAYGLSASTDLNESSDLWVVGLARGDRTRVTFSGNNRFYPIWKRDGTRLTYADGTASTNQILWSAADGTGHAEVLLKNDGRRYPTSWSPDGHTLAYYLGGSNVSGPVAAPSRDIWMLRVDGDKRTETPFIQEPFEERGAIFSPNGRWVAYVSTKSGQNDVYARPSSGAGGEVTVSVGGGQEPVWAPSGRELFYRNAGKLWSVAISETTTSLIVGAPSKVFDDPYRLDTGGAAGGMANYDILPNGQHFVMVEDFKAAGELAPQTVHLQMILNWQDELKRRAPAR